MHTIKNMEKLFYNVKYVSEYLEKLSLRQIKDLG